jgi:hypothetical protein
MSEYDRDPKGATTTIRHQIDSTPTGSRVTVRHEGFKGNPADCDNHAQGWERVLTWLLAHLHPA